MRKFKNKYRIASNRWRFWDYSSPGRYFVTICIINRQCILGNVIDKQMKLSELGKMVKSELLKIPQYHKRVILDEWIVMPNHIHCLIELRDYNFDNGRVDIDNNNGRDNQRDVQRGGQRDAQRGGQHDAQRGDQRDDQCGNQNDVQRGGQRDVNKIHEFYLPTSSHQHQQPPSSSHPWWHRPNYQPTIDEIKQYRKHRRKMIIPKILGKMKMQTSKQINIFRNTPGHKNWQHDYHDHVIRNNTAYHRIKNYIINNPRNWKGDTFHKE